MGSLFDYQVTYTEWPPGPQGPRRRRKVTLDVIQFLISVAQPRGPVVGGESMNRGHRLEATGSWNPATYGTGIGGPWGVFIESLSCLVIEVEQGGVGEVEMLASRMRAEGVRGFAQTTHNECGGGMRVVLPTNRPFQPEEAGPVAAHGAKLLGIGRYNLPAAWASFGFPSGECVRIASSGFGVLNISDCAAKREAA
jgi:hypothetical protein